MGLDEFDFGSNLPDSVNSQLNMGYTLSKSSKHSRLHLATEVAEVGREMDEKLLTIF